MTSGLFPQIIVLSFTDLMEIRTVDVKTYNGKLFYYTGCLFLR